MQIPSWLAKATGATFFAADPIGALAGGAGQGPTMGDALQGIGHSLMENGRQSFGNGQPASGQPTMRDLALQMFPPQGAATGGGAASQGGSIGMTPLPPAQPAPQFQTYKPPTMFDLSALVKQFSLAPR